MTADGKSGSMSAYDKSGSMIAYGESGSARVDYGRHAFRSPTCSWRTLPVPVPVPVPVPGAGAGAGARTWFFGRSIVEVAG
ncbi:hypothetical protein [Nocardia sp. NPDC020380]|uniref:hypothetical protein n=1 Tax=Nocardia sp. NPDC020380 TaxID=3364309 RepID=UPI0037979DA9